MSSSESDFDDEDDDDDDDDDDESSDSSAGDLNEVSSQRLDEGQGQGHQSQQDMIRGQGQHQSLPPTAEKFKIAIIFPGKDGDLAGEVKSVMNQIDLNDGRKVEVYDHNDPNFGFLKTHHPAEFTRLCSLSFALLTSNSDGDNKFQKYLNEAVAETDMEARDGRTPGTVLPLHTMEEGAREYRIPKGLINMEGIEWQGDEEQFKRKLKHLLECFIQRKSGNVQGTHASNPHGSPTLSRAESLPPELEPIINQGNRLRRSKQQKLFYRTFAFTQARDLLLKNRSVFLIGQSGDGKTATAYHILEELLRNDNTLQGIVIQKLDHLECFLKHASEQQKYVVLADDIFGTSTTSSHNIFQRRENMLEQLKVLVDDGTVFFIATSLKRISSELCLDNVPLLGCMIDTTLPSYNLRKYEKRHMLKEYLQKHKVKYLDDMIEKAASVGTLPIGFPQCCEYFVSNSHAKALGHKFFQNPLVCLQKKISLLRKGNNFAYLVMALTLFKNGKLPHEAMDPLQSDCKKVMEMCGVHSHTPKGEIMTAANQLCVDGYLVSSETENAYYFPHHSVHHAMCVVFAEVSVDSIIKICPFHFLLDNVSTDKSKESLIHVKENAHDVFLGRLVQEIEIGNEKIFEHNAFRNKRFIEKIRKNSKLMTSLEMFFSSDEIVTRLISSRMLYFLTTSISESPFVNMVLDMLQKLHIPQKQRLLHDILEGTCASANLTLFKKVTSVGVKPCENCCLLAAESSSDQPYIMKALPPASYAENQMRIIKAMVKKGKVKTVKCISESINWHYFHILRRSQKLFKAVCLKGDTEMFHFLSKKVPLPKETDELLLSAISGKKAAIVKKLLNEENKNCKDKLGRTPLHHACYHAPNMPKLCKLFVDEGVDLNAVDNRGAMPFHWACLSAKKKNVLEDLLKLGLKVTITKEPPLSPLHMAAQNENGAKLVEFILKKANENGMVNFRDSMGRTPLHIASGMASQQEMVRILLEKGDDQQHLQTDNQEKTALHIAAEAYLLENIVILADKYKNVNAVDKEQQTPLHYAVKGRNLTRDQIEMQEDSVEHLLKKGADVNSSDRNENMPLHIAASNRSSLKVFELLLKKKQKIMCNAKNETPLHLLFSPDLQLDVFELVLKKHSYKWLSTVTECGKSVLHAAINSKAPFSVVKTLMEKKACMKKTKWESMNIHSSLSHFTPEQIVSFLKSSLMYLPFSVKQKMMEYLCKIELSFEKWKEGMELLEHSMTKSNPLSFTDPSLLHGVADSCEKVKYLLHKGASVHANNTLDTSILHRMIDRGNHDGVRLLLNEPHLQDLLHVEDHEKNTVLLKAVKRDLADSFLEVQDFCCQTPKVNALYRQLQKHVHSYFGKPKRPHSAGMSMDIISRHLSADILNAVDKHRNAAVHYASHDLNILKKLQAAGADLHKKGGRDQTCLHFAFLKKSNADVVHFLLSHGLQTDAVDCYGYTPLLLGIALNTIDVPFMNQLGNARVANKCGRFSVLHFAAHFSNIDIVKRVIECCAGDVYTTDLDGYLPIHCAVANGKLEVVRLLTETMKTHEGTFQGKPATDMTPIKQYHPNPLEVLKRSSVEDVSEQEDMEQKFNKLSLSDGKSSNEEMFVVNENESSRRVQLQETVEIQLGTTADTGKVLEPLNTSSTPFATNPTTAVADKSGIESPQQIQSNLKEIMNWEGRNLLCFAALYNNKDIIDFLIEEGFKIDEVDPSWGSPLHNAVQYEGLMEKSDMEGFSGCPEVHISQERGRLCVIEHLLKLKVHLETVIGEKRMTPLHIACTTSFPYMKVMSLLHHGALANQTSLERKNALHYICANETLSLWYGVRSSLQGTFKLLGPVFDTIEIPQIFIDKGCGINDQDAEGQTALHLAAATGNALFVSVLLENNADINLVDNHRRSPLHRALEQNILAKNAFLPLRPYRAALKLVEKCAKPDMKDFSGKSPLEMLSDLTVDDKDVRHIQEFLNMCKKD